MFASNDGSRGGMLILGAQSCGYQHEDVPTRAITAAIHTHGTCSQDFDGAGVFNGGIDFVRRPV